MWFVWPIRIFLWETLSPSTEAGKWKAGGLGLPAAIFPRRRERSRAERRGGGDVLKRLEPLEMAKWQPAPLEPWSPGEQHVLSQPEPA